MSGWPDDEPLDRKSVTRIDIEVKGVQVRQDGIEYPFPMYQVTAKRGNEIFGEEPCQTEGEARALLKGLQMGLSIGGVAGIFIPGVPPRDWIMGRNEPVIERGGTFPVPGKNEV